MKPKQTKQPADRVFVGLMVLAAAIRITYWLTKWNQPLKINDSLYYSLQARLLAHGQLFRQPLVDQPGAEHGPITSTLMAPFSWGNDPVRWQRTVTVVCGIVLVWLIGRIARRLAGRQASLVAVGIAAVYPNLWLSDGLVMSESISMLTLATVLWFALDAAECAHRRSFISLGVALGLAALARPELLLLAPLVIAWLGISRRRRGQLIMPAVVSVALVAVLVLSPWVGFNIARFERPLLLTTNEGSTLLGANCDESYYGYGTGGWNVFCVVEGPISADEDPSVRSERHRSAALTYIRGHLGDLPRVVLARVGRTLDLYGMHDLIRGDVGEERPRLWAWAGVPCFWLLAIAAPFGARHLARRERWLLLVPIVGVIFTSVVFYGGHRIRSSAEPSLMLLAAMAIYSWIARLLQGWRT